MENRLPAIAKDCALAVQAENRIREAGDLPLDETITEALKVSLRNLIQKTHWPNVDLISAPEPYPSG